MKKVGILGGGFVGQRFVQMLYEHPYFNLEIITGNSTAGKKLKDIWGLDDFVVPEELEDMEIERGGLDDIKYIAERIDLAFSALPSGEVPKELEISLAEQGVKVFSNSSAMRMKSDIPLVIPEVNGSDLELVRGQAWYENNGGCIIKNPNCSATGLLLPLKPIDDLCGLEEVNVTTYQALSGAGKGAYPGGVMVSNVIPFIRQEEEKIEIESKKMMHNPDVIYSVSCSRVPVIDGHTEHIQVRVKNQKDVEELKQYIQSFNPLKEYGLYSSPKDVLYIFEEEDRPQPRLDRMRGNGMTVSVGRLRTDNIFNYKFFSLSHNTIRGAAGGSVLNAELFYKLGLGD